MKLKTIPERKLIIYLFFILKKKGVCKRKERDRVELVEVGSEGYAKMKERERDGR